MNALSKNKTWFYPISSVINLIMLLPAINDITSISFHSWVSLRTDSIMVIAKSNNYICFLKVLIFKTGSWLTADYYYANLYFNCILYSHWTIANLFFRVLSHWKYVFLSSFIILDQITIYLFILLFLLE